MDTHVVIDGLPRNVTLDRKDKFKVLLEKKIVEQLGHSNFVLKLVDGDGFVVGAFLDCRTVAEADKAIAKLNHFRLTKADVFEVTRWSDFEALEDVPDEYEEPEEEDEESTIDMTNPFLMDAMARPQLLVKAGENFDVHWLWLNATTEKFDHVRNINDTKHWSEVDRKNKRLQQGMPAPLPMWSPQGTFIIAQHPGCVRLYGGKGMNFLTEFPAPELRYVQMSPCEKFLVLYGREFAFWDVSKAKLIKTMPGEVPSWPVFKYSADDSMCATFNRSRGFVLVFDSETMQLLVQELPPRYTLQVDGMNSFSWSPTNPAVFAYGVEGDNATGFRVQIDRIVRDEDEEGQKMCTVTQMVRRNFFQTERLDLLWHPEGTHLAAKIQKTSGAMSFGIFRVGASTASVEAIDVKGEPLRFAWQPNSSRFAIMTDATKTTKQKLWFYQSERVGFKEVGNFQSDGVLLYWAPKGTRCVSVNFDKSRLEFFGVQGCGPFASTEKMQFIISTEHPMVTNAEWDPTGRFFCSYTSSLTQQMDNSYMVWNVNGQKIYEQRVARVSHCNWRPLSQSLLTAADLTKIKAELPKKAQQYKEETLRNQKKADEVAAETRRKAIERYRKIMDSIEAHHQAKGFDEERARLRATAPWAVRQEQQLKSLPPVMEEREVEAE